MRSGLQCGVLRFCGATRFSAGIWAGIELEEPAGKNDGSVAGVSYFKCSPKYGKSPLNSCFCSVLASNRFCDPYTLYAILSRSIDV